MPSYRLLDYHLLQRKTVNYFIMATLIVNLLMIELLTRVFLVLLLSAGKNEELDLELHPNRNFECYKMQWEM
jgi:hypothetical protein